ncbi:MAG: GAF domain-containing protein [Microcoleus sp. PH2017_25_DOB_D_A]|uniref:GAF domain-containing sensor histidine kinase n=1 Tax=unclassified Microcoleus TaxID=2642155 RepID=UPI001DD5A61C|nr:MULTISPECIES: GAF domain-containing protein [unclassified Microcoleus]TAE10319.1 MAG: GAF domain-containing protein [Oscillatoriales cyanobacterium]MCC3436152.1 GAF domain-containing protein [Microcoleus sp. PH2017_05_CCC_O_A]MCC3449061.1 GAF domain-containing protein [Microcoleus sp. PH2017_09_SFU_O_A]MCC3492181.1 GAF domain-containing protein [Microcoleus sp. PH2017_16_JOR_D_A]MCC3514731.1 GAF domain-containing protein [Microcoleus sp. PH2017_18_LLB_O_A]
MSLKIQQQETPWQRLTARLPESGNWNQEEGLSLPEVDQQKAIIVQMQQQVQLSNLLNEINNEIRSTLDIEQILTSACRLLGQALQCSRASILVKESNTEKTLVTRGEYNAGDYPIQLGMKVPITDNPHLAAVVSGQESLALTKFLDFPGLNAQTRKIAETLEIKSMLAVATRYQGEVNGIIGLHQCDREREWTDWERQLLEGVASQLAIAINQAKLYSKTRRQAERESLLRLIGNQIRSTLDLGTILQTAVREVRQWLQCDRVIIYQFQDNWQGTVVVEDMTVPWPSILGDMGEDKCFRGNYADLYQQGRVKAINDIFQAGLEPCHVDFLDSLQVKANLIVPIVTSQSADNSLSTDINSPVKFPGKLWGLLIAHECGDTRNWQRQEMELLSQLADQMAIAIQQAELYSQVREAAVKSQAQTQQLQAALQELRSAQQQLIQSEKMSGLGQMVAGIAHEINNANNFIHANLFHAQEYFKVLNEALELCGNACPEAAEAIVRINEELELDYVRDDFGKLLNSMREGSSRIRAIVMTLRNFSRLDHAEFKAVDLHEGLESSLLMLQNKLKSNIKIDKQYGNLPPVKCHAGQINQVFYNLIDNALDAIDSADKPGELTIRSWLSEPDWVTISVRDTGSGIPAQIQDKIFDPFFTTKPVGKGTGLGLSVCYQVIVQAHGGRIRCVSQVGEGTELIVELPLTNQKG